MYKLRRKTVLDMNNAGYVVIYNSQGAICKGIVRHAEQNPVHKLKHKALIRPCNNLFVVELDESGKEKGIIKDVESVTVTGFLN